MPIVVLAQVRDVNYMLALNEPKGSVTRSGAHWMRQEFGVFARNPPVRYGVKGIPIKRRKRAERNLAEFHRLFEDRIEHGREVAGRRIDDLQYLGSRGLLLQSLARLGQEPRVLHRDDRLRREVLQQRDLLVGERTYFSAIDPDDAEQGAFFPQRDNEAGSGAGEFDKGATVGVTAAIRRLCH